MKLAVLSDVHGNVPALSAVLADIERWQPDELVVNGDLVSRGPCSLACIRLLRKQFPAACLLRGNHEHFVLDCAGRVPDIRRPGHVLQQFAYWTCEQLGDSVAQLRTWADELDLADWNGHASVHVTHGSRLGNRDGIRPENDDRQLRRKLGSPRDLFVGSHTHRPMVRWLDETLVINSGSVGQPFDDDARACYARLEFFNGKWHAEIARVPYDKQQAERDFIDSGFMDQCGPLARLIFLEHRHNRMLVGTWMGLYGDAVASGEQDAERAVVEFLKQLNLS